MFARLMLAVAVLACAGAGSAQAEWTAQILRRFVIEGDGSNFGYNPRLGVLLVGNTYYGVSTNGGVDGGGVIWRRGADGKMAVLYSFTDGDRAGCGYGPSSRLIRDSAGRLYGTTFSGGPTNQGVVFRLDDTGKAEWKCRVLHSFRKARGNHPFGGLLLQGKVLYGVAQSGGKYNAGVVYRVNWNNKDGSTTDTYRVLYSFRKPGPSGYGPAGKLAVDANGVMYGATFFGGRLGGGTIYRITRAGAFKAIHHFDSANTRRGYQPTQGPLLIDKATNTLYGATSLGGCPDGDTTCGNGTATTPGGVLFSMKTTGAGYQVLHTFDSSTNAGYSPYGGLIMKSNGALFGVAQLGGSRGGGVAFRFGNGNYGVLRNFDPDNDGYLPSGGLVFDNQSNLIGTNFRGGGDSGTLFRLKP
jgi:uncharacterized repeat protein (TIGR03803 family)